MVRTRFAPSPTGSLHVGGARTALYCLLHARRQGGRFLLRVEDTDQVRSTDEAAAGLLRDLRWLGLLWDEGPDAGGDAGPWFQSQRLSIYDRYLDALVASGHAYEAWDSAEELTAARKEAEAAKRNFRYVRRAWTAEELAAFRAEGRRPVLRLVAPDHDITVQDDILGPVHLAQSELDDLVIRKADGFPTYHFAVVIDDHLMGVTQILRGQEHLMNTPKHLSIYEALGWDAPQHGHLPLIFNPGGAKMSKRDKAKTARAAALAQQRPEGWGWLAETAGLAEEDVAAFCARKHDGVATAEAIGAALGVDLPMIEVMDFRRGGYLPDALLNYLALLGWSPGDDREILSIAEMTEAFSLDGINKTAARFDPVKLAWMNGEYIRRCTPDALLAHYRGWLDISRHSRFADMPDTELTRWLALYQPRMSTLADLDRMTTFFFVRPTTWDADAVKKHLLKADGLVHLADAAEALARSPWTAADIDAALAAVADAGGVGVGKVAQPVRVAVSGGSVSPPIGETLALIPREEVLARLIACREAVAPTRTNTAGAP